MRRIRRKQDTSKTRNAHPGKDSRDDSVTGQSAEKPGVKSSQRVRAQALRVMRNTRERLDDALLARARAAVIESAIDHAESEQSIKKDAETLIDTRKNLQTIQTLLEKHSTSQDMQRNIAAILQEMRKQ